jgi:hypothetical protein
VEDTGIIRLELGCGIFLSFDEAVMFGEVLKIVEEIEDFGKRIGF